MKFKNVTNANASIMHSSIFTPMWWPLHGTPINIRHFTFPWRKTIYLFMIFYIEDKIAIYEYKKKNYPQIEWLFFFF